MIPNPVFLFVLFFMAGAAAGTRALDGAGRAFSFFGFLDESVEGPPGIAENDPAD